MEVCGVVGRRASSSMVCLFAPDVLELTFVSSVAADVFASRRGDPIDAKTAVRGASANSQADEVE
jgi:hypothetical protein